MNLKKNLVFLGMMGSGKSSIGNLVSKKLNIKFIDVDNIIEDMMGMSISSIFLEKGEEYFRNLEEKITLKNLKLDGNIIALGGGGFINEKIRKEILNNHLSFWLTWEDSIIIKRIKGSKKRPLAMELSDHDLKQLIKKRSKIYQKAKFKINCNKQTKTEIVKKIIKIYESN